MYAVRRCSRAIASRNPDAALFAERKPPMLKNLTIVFGLVAGLSACAAPYEYPGYGYTEPAYYGPAYYGPVYYGPGYYPPHSSEHGTVQY